MRLKLHVALDGKTDRAKSSLIFIYNCPLNTLIMTTKLVPSIKHQLTLLIIHRITSR